MNLIPAAIPANSARNRWAVIAEELNANLPETGTYMCDQVFITRARAEGFVRALKAIGAIAVTIVREADDKYRVYVQRDRSIAPIAPAKG